MAQPYHNLRSKLERAIRAYLIAQGCGSETNIHISASSADRTFPNTTVKATIGSPDIMFSGNYRIRTMIIIRGSARQSDGSESELSRILFDERLGKTFDALMQSDDGATLRYTAKAVTSAGRLLVPATLSLFNSGETDVNGAYEQTSDTLWSRVAGGATIEYNSGTETWLLKDVSSTTLYSCPLTAFPSGPWTVVSGGSPAPQLRRQDNWDMDAFTALEWYDAGFGDMEAEDEGCDWREALLFDVVCAANNITGYSLTD